MNDRRKIATSGSRRFGTAAPELGNAEEEVEEDDGFADSSKLLKSMYTFIHNQLSL